MIIKTRTAILILIVAFIIFFSLAAWLIHRLTVQMRQSTHDNSTYVSEQVHLPKPEVLADHRRLLGEER